MFGVNALCQLALIFAQIRSVSIIKSLEMPSQNNFERLVCHVDIWAAIDAGEIKPQDEVLSRSHPSFINIFLYIESLW
jgi:hypothetical protein